MEIYEITIIVDINDADYITAVGDIDSDDLEKIKPLITKIKEFKPYKGKTNSGDSFTHRNNYPYGEIRNESYGEKESYEIYDVDEEVFDIFEDFLPATEFGFHTIISIEICPKQEKIKLL